MKNLRFARADHSVIQVEDDEGRTLNIPVAPGNRHFEEIRAQHEAGEIAPFVPDPIAVEGAKRAKAQSNLLAALLAGNKPIDEILADARAELATGAVVRETKI